MKKLLISLALGVVCDALIAVAQRKLAEAATREYQERWAWVVSMLQDIKSGKLPL